jgi:hypothetical protein
MIHVGVIVMVLAALTALFMIIVMKKMVSIPPSRGRGRVPGTSPRGKVTSP